MPNAAFFFFCIGATTASLALVSGCNSGSFEGNNAVTRPSSSQATGGATTAGGAVGNPTAGSTTGSSSAGGNTAGNTTIGGNSSTGTTGNGGTGTVDSGLGTTVPGDSTRPGGNLGETGGHLCVKGTVDLNVMFLLDSTGSMGRQNAKLASGLPSMVNQVTAFRAQLGNRVQNFRMGFISYIDQERRGDDGRSGSPLVLNPTTDIAMASSFISANAQSANDHSDTAEGGLWALNAGLQAMKSAASPRSSAINVAIIVTDAWSHDGTPHSSDCQGSPNDCHDNGQRTFNSAATEALLADPYFNGFFLFDWSKTSRGVDGQGDFGDGTVGRFNAPQDQWAYMRQRWQQLHNVPRAQGGAHLGDEISNGTSEMTQMINVLASQVSLCP